MKLTLRKDEVSSSIKKYNDEDIEVKQTSEIAEALKELNVDKLDPHTKLTEIDMRSNLNRMEVAGIIKIDTLHSLGMLPTETELFTRRIKRVRCSTNGFRSEQMVRAIIGRMEGREGGGQNMIQKIGGWFNGNKENNS